MRERLRQMLDRVRSAPPGERFVGVYERSRAKNFAVRVGLVVFGLLLMIAAAVTFWVPGPNVVLVIAGLAIVCGQSRFAAHHLDRLEVALRRWHDTKWEPYPHKRRLLAMLAVVAAALAALAAWYAWRRGWIPFLN